MLFFITSERLDIKFRAEKLCAHFYYAPNILLWGTKFCARKQFCSNNLEGMNSKFLFPERWKINWHILKPAKAHLKYPQGPCFFNVVHASKRQNSRSARHCIQKILHQTLRFFQPWRSWIVVFIDMNM